MGTRGPTSWGTPGPPRPAGLRPLSCRPRPRGGRPPARRTLRAPRAASPPRRRSYGVVLAPLRVPKHFQHVPGNGVERLPGVYDRQDPPPFVVLLETAVLLPVSLQATPQDLRGVVVPA